MQGVDITNDILLLAAAANYLSCAPRTLRSWIKQGIISYYDKIGGVYRFSISKHLQPFLDAREVVVK